MQQAAQPAEQPTDPYGELGLTKTARKLQRRRYFRAGFFGGLGAILAWALVSLVGFLLALVIGLAVGHSILNSSDTTSPSDPTCNTASALYDPTADC